MTPAVVATINGVTLADRLRLSELPLATTPGGRNFTLKALHPSEHTIKVSRVPGGNRNSVAVCCDMIKTVDCPNPGGAGDWVAHVRLIPSILAPCQVTTYDTNVTPDYHVMFNAAFGGQSVRNPTTADWITAFQSLASSVSSYRITSQSATVEYIAPTTSSQGAIVAAQYSIPPRTMNATTTSASTLSAKVDCYLYPPMVGSTELLMGTTAYTSKAVEGVYMPLKLTSFKWRDMFDTMIPYPGPPALVTGPETGIANTTSITDTPYYEDRTGVTFSTMCPHPKLCGSLIGDIRCTGLSGPSALRVRVRQVVEISCRPGSVYAPLLEPPLPPDHIALAMYQEISGRMKDAYPASWNDLGKLRDAVLKVGKTLLPFVDPALSALEKAGGPLGVSASLARKIVPPVQDSKPKELPIITQVVGGEKPKAKKKKPKKSEK